MTAVRVNNLYLIPKDDEDKRRMERYSDYLKKRRMIQRGYDDRVNMMTLGIEDKETPKIQAFSGSLEAEKVKHRREAHQGKPSFHCEACVEAKLKTKPFPKKTNRRIHRIGMELHHDYIEFSCRDPWGNLGAQVYLVRQPGYIIIDFIEGPAQMADQLCL